MKRRPKKQEPMDGFEIVKAVGLTFRGAEAPTQYAASPVLKLTGCFMAGVATHSSAEPATLVVRVGCDEREWLIEDAPQTCYLQGYYRRYPLLLGRRSR